ncbi:MAG: hypothetical protein NUW12_01455 [Firmicutes bacterium]|jgi:hypothetical protein|nr:hypothetical protein [Bacillota bacterium]MDH7494612.1 hypothetical protein [Bacillota bacterium]
MELEEYRLRAEAFLRDLNEELYLNGAGLKASLDTSSIYERNADLFEKCEVLAILEMFRGATKPSVLGHMCASGTLSGTGADGEAGSESSARCLAGFACDGFLAAATRDITDAIVSAETLAVVEFEGREIPFRNSKVVLANEPNERARAALEAERQRVTIANNPRREERMETFHSLVRDLGYTDYKSFCADVGGIDLDSLGQAMQDLLDETEAAYTRAMERAAGSVLGMRLRDVRRHDLAFLFRGARFDEMFREEKVVPTLEATVAGMGLSIRNHPNIHIDSQARDNKSPRAFCAPLDVPGKVMLVIMPHGGHDDYHSILHEAGHAWHYGNVRPDLPFEHRWLGDDSVTEAYAFLFEYLATCERWLAENTAGTLLEEYRAFALLHKLYMVRRYAAKLLYELRLHGGSDLAEMPREYASILTDALKVRYPESDYLTDVDDGFYSARYLRAWVFEAHLRHFLMKRFGERWYAYAETGAALRELFSEGQRLPVDALAARLGIGAADPAPLVEEILDSL